MFSKLPSLDDVIAMLVRMAFTNPSVLEEYYISSGWNMRESGIIAISENSLDGLADDLIDAAKKYGRDFIPMLMGINHILCHATHEQLILSKEVDLPDELSDVSKYEMVMYIVYHNNEICTIHHIQDGYRFILSKEDAQNLINQEKSKYPDLLKVIESNDIETNHKSVFVIHSTENEHRLFWSPSWDRLDQSLPANNTEINSNIDNKSVFDNIVTPLSFEDIGAESVPEEDISAFSDFIKNMKF